MITLSQYAQWIPVKLVPLPDGCTKKIPLNCHTRKPIPEGAGGAHNPSVWGTHAQAVASVARLGRGHCLGFVITEADPFFCIDIDHALQPDNTWHPLALSIAARLPGTVIELGQSGTGWHIWGAGPVPKHCCRGKAPAGSPGLEMYSKLRFIAITMQSEAPNAPIAPWCPGITALANEFFPAALTATRNAPSDGPRPDWNGPTDDDELLRRALRSTSAGATFDGRPAFRDLWFAEADVLGRAYPAPGRPYDASAADTALASHLAFWTGCDVERIERLMRQSSLVREKWDTHPLYLRGKDWSVIDFACGNRDVVLQDRPPAAPTPVAAVADSLAPTAPTPVAAAARTATPPATAAMTARTAAPFLDAARQAQLFDGCTYVVDDDRVLLPTGEMVNAPRFKVLFGGYVFMMDARNERTTRNAYEAFTESQVLAPPIANGTCFKPLEPFGAMFESEGRRRVNIYTPAKVARKVGDPKPLLDHLARLLPDRHDRDVLTYYMAGVVQHQGHKFQWFPLIVGPEGNGKTVFSRCVARAVGERFSHWPKQAEIGSKFNGWLSGKTFIAIEDLKLDDDGQTWEKMKPMVTGDRLEIESKGIDQRTEEVCCNFIANSNHRDAVKAASDARRVAHLWCAQETPADLQRDGMGEAYFRDLYNWLNNSDGYAIVAEWLHTMHVPATFGLSWLKGRAPQTSTTARAVEDSRSDEERAVLDAIENLEVGFHGGWISSSYLAQRTQRLSAAQRKALLLRIGYVPHPALERGGKHQVDNVVEPDGCKPTLYVRQGTPAAKLTERAGVATAYTRAQVADLKAAIKKRDDEEAKRKAAAG